jgi:N-acetyl-alpha-D-muramate 1-phosphate uridylyltransferase
MKAMIFCAGLGTRFKPWTDTHPKALAVINGKSLLQRNIEYLQQYNITDVIVNVHHFPEQIIDVLNRNKGFGSNVVISDESDLVLETGGGLLKAKQLFTPGEDFLTINVDILTSLDLHAFIEFHQKQKAMVSLATSGRKSSRCFVFDENDRLTGWRNLQSGEEKIRVQSNEQHNRSFSGISLFNYSYFDKLQLEGKFSLVDAYLSLAAENPIYGFDHTGDKWVDVGRLESVATAEGMFK